MARRHSFCCTHTHTTNQTIKQLFLALKLFSTHNDIMYGVCASDHELLETFQGCKPQMFQAIFTKHLSHFLLKKNEPEHVPQVFSCTSNVHTLPVGLFKILLFLCPSVLVSLRSHFLEAFLSHRPTHIVLHVKVQCPLSHSAQYNSTRVGERGKGEDKKEFHNARRKSLLCTYCSFSSRAVLTF